MSNNPLIPDSLPGSGPHIRLSQHGHACASQEVSAACEGAEPCESASAGPDKISIVEGGASKPLFAEDANSYLKAKAGTTFRTAVREGLADAPTVCESCGKKETRSKRRTILAHHWSYAAEHRLDVIGLCRRCHSLVHRGELVEPRTGRMYPPAEPIKQMWHTETGAIIWAAIHITKGVHPPFMRKDAFQKARRWLKRHGLLDLGEHGHWKQLLLVDGLHPFKKLSDADRRRITHLAGEPPIPASERERVSGHDRLPSGGWHPSMTFAPLEG